MREVSAETLLAAIQDGKPWLARFTGKEFDKAYQEYRERYAALFREAALADGEEGIEALAEVLRAEASRTWPPIRVLVNQAEDETAMEAARRLAERLPWPVCAGALKRRSWICLSSFGGPGTSPPALPCACGGRGSGWS